MCKIKITIDCGEHHTMRASDKYQVHVSDAEAALILTPGDPNQATQLPDEIVGQPATDFDIVASGGTGPYSFSVDGDLPPGMSAASDGVDTLRIFGTPTAAGDFAWTVNAVDSAGAAAKTTRFSRSVS